MLELLSPAGSPESVLAAVQNGADAVYMGLGDFNARRNATNFNDEEFEKAVRYCHVRGCKVYVTMNTLVLDREMPSALELARRVSDVGADAILVQDLGLLSVLRRAVPDIPLHASTQMSLHSLEGVKAAAKMGLTRAVLSRELPFEQIKYIAKNAPIETEIFVHGALCFSYSGQCYMSSLIGRRSGNRGMCAQPCRLEYTMGGRNEDSHPLSLKDNCLVEHLQEIEDAGVACVKIEGRMKRPEYTGIVTGVYSKVIREHRTPTEEELLALETAFSRQGFTQGYFKGDKSDMFGVRGVIDRETESVYRAARKAYADKETNRVPVKLYAVIDAGTNILGAAEDAEGHKVALTGEIPQKAMRTPLSEEQVNSQLGKTGGTPYFCEAAQSRVAPNLYVPVKNLNALRNELLDKLSEERAKPPVRRSFELPDKLRTEPVAGTPADIYQVLTAEQLSPALAEMKPACVYVPLTVMCESFDKLKPFVMNGTVPVVVLPRVITDNQTDDIRKKLRQLYSLGIREALVGNLGHISLAREAGMQLRADFGMNVFNSYSLEMIKVMGFKSATVSFEMMMAQIRDMAKCLPTEIIAYGRLPLMVTEQCIISRSAGKCSCTVPNQLSDRKGQKFPVVREYDHRNVIYNAHKLFMADKWTDVCAAGIWAQRLIFTTESAEECVMVAKSYRGENDYRPNDLTRGLYYRGVETK